MKKEKETIVNYNIFKKCLLLSVFLFLLFFSFSNKTYSATIEKTCTSLTNVSGSYRCYFAGGSPIGSNGAYFIYNSLYPSTSNLVQEFTYQSSNTYYVINAYSATTTDYQYHRFNGVGGDDWIYQFLYTAGVPSQNLDTTTRIVSHSPASGELINTLVGNPTATSSDNVEVDVDIYFNDTVDGGYIDTVCVNLQPIENPNITLLPICHPITASAFSTINFDFGDTLHGQYYAIAYFTNTVDLGTHFFSVGWNFTNMYSEIPSQSCLYGSTLGVCNEITGMPLGYATTTSARNWDIPLHDCSTDTSITAKLGCALINTLISTVNFLFVPNGDQYITMIYDIKDKALTHFPIGYITDFVTIISTSTVGTLTVIDATLPSALGLGTPNVRLDLTGVLDPYLNATTSSFNNVSASSTRTLFEITNDYWEKVCYLLALLYILRRIFGTGLIGHHNKKTE